jgi:nicotinamidase-related amidase
MGDVVLEISFASIFLGRNFEFILRILATSTIIFTGIAIKTGFESSVRDASARGLMYRFATGYPSVESFHPALLRRL